jgi:hypothetical protein
VDDDGQPIGYLLLAKGTPVVLSDRATLGTVAKVLDNEREHIFDGIVVKTEEGRVFVDAPEVARITDQRVTLTIDSTEAEALPAYRGLLGALETGAQRRAGRIKRRFGR